MPLQPDARDWREYALELMDNGMIDPEMLLTACLWYMTTDEVYDMLDSNELSPRFMPDEWEDEEDEST